MGNGRQARWIGLDNSMAALVGGGMVMGLGGVSLGWRDVSLEFLSRERFDIIGSYNQTIGRS